MALAMGGTGQKRSMIVSVTNDGKAHRMIKDGAFKHEPLPGFLESLIKDTGKKILRILDHLGVHHCKPARVWLVLHQAQMEVFYLPSYSPDLNPEEHLRANLKQVIRSKMLVRTKTKLQAAATEHLITQANEPERVTFFLQVPFVKYAG